mgnify:CR=1 FL=1
MDELQHVICRFTVVFTVALQYLLLRERIFQRNEGNVGVLLVPDKEDKAFFADKALVVIHSAYAMVERCAFADKILRGTRDHDDERIFLAAL